MLDQLLNPAAGDDPYRRRANHIDGAWSILAGIAANVAMERGQTVSVAELLGEADIACAFDRDVMCDTLQA